MNSEYASELPPESMDGVSETLSNAEDEVMAGAGVGSCDEVGDGSSDSRPRGEDTLLSSSVASGSEFSES